MASQLENLIRKQIGAGFKGKLLTGTLTRTTGTTVNEYGDVVTGAPSTFTVEGFVDQYDARYRAQAGIPESDSKITLILENCETSPKKDDKIAFTNWQTFTVRSVMTDPARASAECQVFEGD